MLVLIRAITFLFFYFLLIIFSKAKRVVISGNQICLIFFIFLIFYEKPVKLFKPILAFVLITKHSRTPSFHFNMNLDSPRHTQNSPCHFALFSLYYREASNLIIHVYHIVETLISLWVEYVHLGEQPILT